MDLILLSVGLVTVFPFRFFVGPAWDQSHIPVDLAVKDNMLNYQGQAQTQKKTLVVCCTYKAKSLKTHAPVAQTG